MGRFWRWLVVLGGLGILLGGALALAEEGAESPVQAAEMAQAKALMEQVLAAQEGGRHQEIIRLLDQLLVLLPEYADAYILRAYSHASLGHYEQAVADARVGTRLAPNSAVTWGSLGWYLILSNQIAEGRVATQKAVTLDPSSESWNLNLGHTYLLEGEYKTAHEWYINAVFLTPDEERLQLSLADFDMFIQRGWQVDASREEKAWMREAYTLWQKAKDYNERAVSLHRDGRVKESIPLAEQALPLIETISGEEHPTTATALSNLAQMYTDMGSYAEAEPLYQRALAIRDKQLGPEHRDTASALNGLGKLYYHLSEYARAEPLYQRALAIQEKHLGPEHSDTATSLNNLAALYKDMGSYAKAEPLYQRALAILEKQLGPEHPLTAAALNNLALLHQGMGSHAKAEPLHQRALAIREKQLGPEHSDTAGSLNNLAALYKDMGSLAKAEPLYQRALAILEKQLGPEHPLTATALNNLALLHQGMGLHAKAEPLHQRALAIREKQLGPEHSDTATSLNNLATLLYEMGLYAKAEPLYQRALGICEKQLGPEHPLTATALNNLAEMYTGMGSYAKAEPLYQRALAIREKQLGQEHPDTASALSGLGKLYYRLSEYAKAEPLHQRALAIREKHLGSEHSDTATSLNNLAALYENMGSYAKAEPLYQRALGICEKQLGPEHPSTATALNNLAHMYTTMGLYAKAEPLYQRALAIREKHLGSDHSDTATSLNNLATLLLEMGSYASAEPLLQRALGIYEKQLGPEHPLTATALNNLAHMYAAMGLYAQAEPIHQRALAIREKQLGSEHSDTALSLHSLAGLYRDTGAYDKAKPLSQRALAITMHAGDPELLWKVQGGLRDFLIAHDRPGPAIFFGKLAVNTIQSIRGGLKNMNRDMQKSFISDKKHVYTGLADLLVGQGRILEAQRALAMLKEEELFDFSQGDGERALRSSTMPLARFEKPWFAMLEGKALALRSLREQITPLARLKVRSQEEEQQLTGLRQEFDGQVRQWVEALDDLAAALQPDEEMTAAFTTEELADLKALEKTLGRMGNGAVVVSYLPTDQRVRILLTTPTGMLARESPLTAKELDARIVALRERMQNPRRDPLPAARALYDHLIGPIHDDLERAGARTIMFSLMGAMRYLPMSALYDGEKWLGERYAVTLFTVAAGAENWQPPASNWQVAGFGVSTSSPGFKPLPAVVEELDGIIRDMENPQDATGVLPGRIWLNEKFSSHALSSALMQELYSVFHLSSHFVFSPGTRVDSFLLLGQGERLSLDAFENQDNLRFRQVDLLTLSACKTAVGDKDAYGMEVEGFGALAQYQGAKGVMATLWPVADWSTGAFMKLFYRLREEQHLSKAEALRQAQIQFIQGTIRGKSSPNQRTGFNPLWPEEPSEPHYSPTPDKPLAHPYYWAPFILMGNWL